MTQSAYNELDKELNEFQKEKEKIRSLIGQVGGAKSSRQARRITVIFVIAIIMLFAVDVSRHYFHIPVPLPELFSLQIGVLLVSLKIIMMMHNQMKVDHFQFWILHSIEFKLNQLTTRFNKLEAEIKEGTGESWQKGQ
jgi:hypothetical protein